MMWWRRGVRVRRYLWLILSVVLAAGGAGRDLARPLGATSPTPHAALFILNHESPVNGATWNRAETLILTWDSAAHIWDAESGTRLLDMRHQGLPRILGAAWNDNETRVLTWANDGTARLWDATNGAQLLLLGHVISSEVRGASWSHHESRILTWGADSTARLWDSQNGVELSRYSHMAPVNGAIWSHDETRLLTWSDDGYATLWQDQTPSRQFRHDYGVTGASWSTDESYLLTWGNDGQAKVWDSVTGVLNASLVHAGILGATWQGESILTWGLDGTARQWDKTGQLLGRVMVEGVVWGITPSAAGLWLRTSQGMVYLWGDSGLSLHLSNAQRVRTALPHQAMLLVAAGNGITLWDIPTQSILSQFDHADTIRGASWNQDGTRILSWSADRTARVWTVIQATDCWIMAPANANQRAAPDTSAEFRGTLAANTGRLAIGRTLDSGSLTWWQLDNGNWIREDVVTATGACDGLPLSVSP